MRTLENIILKLGSVDRRVIFVLIGLAVLVPLLSPVDLAIRPGEDSQKVYDTIESLPENSNILISFDYGPSTKPEIHPMTLGVMRHLLRQDRGHKIYITCLWPDGLYMAKDALEIINKEYDLVKNEDYVLLGFRPGNEAIVKGLESDLRKVFTVDAEQTPIDDIPMMEGVNSLNDFQFMFTGSAGYPGTFEWVQYGGDPTGIPLSSGTTSIQVNEVMPYVNTGQLKGILAGMPGAAEYEALIGIRGIATSGMAAQSYGHIVIVLFIILGNLAYFITQRRERKY
tara:strand:+ start:5365 stop:6213 length:849 start_codon:yes stop_codon:yes gene_type:complete